MSLLCFAKNVFILQSIVLLQALWSIQMHIQPINNQSFGKIILQEDRIDGTSSLYLAEPIDEHHKQYLSQYSAERLIDGVIDSDYDTFELRNTYNELIEQQRNNPIDIIIDLFYENRVEPDDFYQKAAVKGKIFKQHTTWDPKVDRIRPTTIKFLENACNYANELAMKLHK